MAITINPASKLFILDSATVDVSDIYVAWVDWLVLSDNIKYLPAFTTVGGDSLGGSLSIPPYYFLINGWRVRPMESSHTLVLTGNLFVDGGGDPIVPTVGSFNVLVKSVVPVQAQGISTGGAADPAVVAAAVRALLLPELERLDVKVSTRATPAHIVALS